jgi:hypothetical protein
MTSVCCVSRSHVSLVSSSEVLCQVFEAGICVIDMISYGVDLRITSIPVSVSVCLVASMFMAARVG